ncbi:hypothetical protein HS088_TW06G01196 [Tripterygium wilfordii]|uniref:Uncharacterized protein n=1 Tax=Tripterygium wilfordii TaxID=458696 RepID=A0A7J7DL73_TRIWF|nr:hypothetical protein HS088_TW06G01196 [Tripterygium wilfordii]
MATRCFFVISLAVLLISSSIFASQARPLGHYSLGNMNKGVDIDTMFDELHIGGIKTGGPSLGGEGHALPDAVRKNDDSGPSPGQGH